MKFYMHQRIIGENLMKIGLILSAQWRFSEERYQACPVTLTMTWRKSKQVLIIEGEKSDEVKRQICMEMLRDNSSLGQPLQTQESVRADKHTCMEEIECLKQG